MNKIKIIKLFTLLSMTTIDTNALVKETLITLGSLGTLGIVAEAYKKNSSFSLEPNLIP